MVGESVRDRELRAAAARSAAAAAARHVRREFHDTAGHVWLAYEQPIPEAEWTTADEQSALAGYGVGWLYFESGTRWRRLRLYPTHWHQLSDIQLEGLCRRARRESAPKS